MSKPLDAPPLTRRAVLAGAAAALSPSATSAAPPNAEDIRRAVGAPAAGVAFQRNGQVTLDFAGIRAQGHDALVAQNDLWHLGSNTKSMTAVLAARLVEKGVISFEDSLGAYLDDVGPDLKTTTLEQLLHHRGGVDANPSLDFVISQKTRNVTDPIALRLKYLSVALTSYVAKPGRFHYSNSSYVAAAAMMEAAAGEPWEALISREVFAPLGLDSPGFGPPGHSISAPDQPWGHSGGATTTSHAPTFDADNPAALNPAGRVHMSLIDFLTYLTAHAQRAPILTPESWARLHKPVVDASARYAMGWVSPSDAVRMHSGSNTIWFATGGFNVRDGNEGDAIAIVTNIGNGANLPGPVEQPALDFLSGV